MESVNWLIISAVLITIIIIVAKYVLSTKKIAKSDPAFNELHVERLKLLRKRKALTETPPDSFSPEKLVSRANSDEQKLLFEILKQKNITPEKVIQIICSKGSHSIASCWRFLHGKKAHIGYDTVIRDVAKVVKTHNVGLVPEIERRIIEKVFKKIKQKLEPDERKRLETAITTATNDHRKSVTGELVSGAAIGAAQLSGFGVYLMASTAVGGISHLVGVTVPFAFYTGMSSTIAVLIGPIGGALLATAFIHKLGSPKYSLTVPAVVLIAAIRSRLNAELEEKLAGIDLRIREIDLQI